MLVFHQSEGRVLLHSKTLLVKLIGLRRRLKSQEVFLTLTVDDFQRFITAVRAALWRDLLDIRDDVRQMTRLRVIAAEHDLDRRSAIYLLKSDPGEWQPVLFLLRSVFAKNFQLRRSRLIAPGELVEIINPYTEIKIFFHISLPFCLV